MSTVLLSEMATIAPSRRLPVSARAVFEKVASEFIHLQPSDAEQLTQYAEAVIRYRTAEKQTRKRPTISSPIVNRATGNIVGEKIVRNPAFATMREAQAQMNSLARRLMIDAHSADKRQRILTKKARALAASESASAASQSAVANLTEFEIQAQIETERKSYIHATEDTLRAQALWYLTVCKPLLDDPEGDDDIYSTLEQNKHDH